MITLLDSLEKIKKDKHSKNVHEQQKKYLFLLYVYGILGREALVIITDLSQLMAEKMNEPILHM